MRNPWPHPFLTVCSRFRADLYLALNLKTWMYQLFINKIRVSNINLCICTSRRWLEEILGSGGACRSPTSSVHWGEDCAATVWHCTHEGSPITGALVYDFTEAVWELLHWFLKKLAFLFFFKPSPNAAIPANLFQNIQVFLVILCCNKNIINVTEYQVFLGGQCPRPAESAGAEATPKGSCWYAWDRSSFEKFLPPNNEMKRCKGLGRGYWSISITWLMVSL